MEKVKNMKKLYQVYSVDTCFDSYAMEYKLVGAEDVEDLISHLKDFIEKKRDRKRIEEDGDWRIKAVEHLYTDVPYKVLDVYGYSE